MSSGKALIFIVLSSTIMMSAVLLQNIVAPQKVDEPAVENVEPDENVKPDIVPQDDLGIAESDLESGSPADPEIDANQPEKASTTKAPTTPSLPDTDTDSGTAGEPENAGGTEPGDEVKQVQSTPLEFPTIGSLAVDGSDRYLVTFNQKGGAIRRVELNFRDKKGRYRYRDAVWKGGYLGCLDCLNTPQGCLVRVVGAGTPAQLAGIKPGDIIVSFNGEPVASAEEFELTLGDPKKSKPKETVEIVVDRNSVKQTISVTLTEKPIEIIRPESGIVDPDFDYPESFIMSLVFPGGSPEKTWPDLDPEMRNGTWEVSSISHDEIEFRFELTESTLKQFNVPGPLTVFKRFQIPELAAESIHKVDSRSFHLNLELEVKNNSDQSQSLAYELDGPTGITAETWWYANKIHGRQTAIGSIAGARDIVGRTGVNSYVFYGCPEIVKAATKSRPKVMFVCDPMEDDPLNRELFNVAVDSHYFNVALIPKTTDNAPYLVNSVSAYPNNRLGVLPQIPKNARLRKMVDMTFQMVAPIEIAPGESFQQSFDVFCGPKEKTLLDDYELGNVRTFGWFSWCSKVLLYVLGFFYKITFSFSYGLAIVLLTIMVRCFMIPMSRKAALNAQMMQHLAPQTKAIAEKYKDDMEKRTAAQRELYKKYKFNPLSGCLMMFVQLPIFYGLYKGLNVDIALRDQPLIPGMSWCSNLAAPDQLLYWKSWMPAALGDETGWLGPYLNILPLITMVLFIAQQKLFTPPPTDDQQKMMQKVMTFMMLFMGIMFFKVPSGLCIYFITSSLWGIIERKMLPKPVLDTDNLEPDGTDQRLSKADRKQARAQEAEMEKKATEDQQRRARNAERKKRLKKRDQN